MTKIVVNTNTLMSFRKIGVVGAGTMGRGIVQLFAQAGHQVLLYDQSIEAADQAVSFVSGMLRRRVEKGELSPDAGTAAIAGIRIVPDLKGFADADLVIEAVAERIEVKQALFSQLEEIVGSEVPLATNTSSLMVTAIAAPCRHPERVVGYHFFNPVPLMKLIEVIRGELTSPDLIVRLSDLTRSVGHMPIVTADTPGFVVNHAGRALYTEGLQLLQDCVASAPAIDALMRDIAGFRMGPFELFDLTGIDVSGPVTASIHTQYFGEPRYRSSPIVQRRIAAGLHGRKTGRGFYRYEGQKVIVDEKSPAAPSAGPVRVFVDEASGHPQLTELVARLGGIIDGGTAPQLDSLILVAPIGRDCASICAEKRYDPTRVVGIETFFGLETKRRCLAAPVGASQGTISKAHALFAADGVPVTICNDSVALVAQRIVCVIINLACEIAQQQIANPADIDSAVRIGLGYPDGPLGLGDRFGAGRVHTVLQSLHALTGDPRYRPSAWLRRRASLGLSLLCPDAVPLA